MELKGLNLGHSLIACPSLDMNPFNGIESSLRSHRQTLGRAPPNPFNGIERIWVPGFRGLRSALVNPFNGIESGIERRLGEPPPRLVHQVATGIHSMELKGSFACLLYERGFDAGNPFNGIESKAACGLLRHEDILHESIQWN